MSYKRDLLATWVIVVLAVSITIVTSVLIYVLFSTEASNLTIELLAAMVAVVLVVASVGVTIHFQKASEIEREYKVKIFEAKVDLYKSFVKEVTEFDDRSNRESAEITQFEFDKLKNLAREIALLGSEELVSELGQYLENVSVLKRLHVGEGYGPDVSSANKKNVEGTFRQVLVELREDLDVVRMGNDESKERFKKEINRIMGLKFEEGGR